MKADLTDNPCDEKPCAAASKPPAEPPSARRTILLMNHGLQLMAGSEITTLETALFLKSAGCEVHVATFQYGPPMEDLFRQHGLPLYNLLLGTLPQREYDIAWCHHAQVLSKAVQQEVRFRKVLLRVLSPIEPLAALPFYARDIDVLAATSPGTAERYYAEGWVEKEKFDLFPNSVPAAFFEQCKSACSRALSRVAVVSNRSAPEVAEAVKRLENQSIRVEIIGAGGTPRLVTPEVLRPYDLVISIGKTVPYCFAMKVPVYCYDRFGGHGYIHRGNFEQAAYYTFSGRCSDRRLTPDELVRDIQNGYPEALDRLEDLRAIAADRYDLKKNVLSFLSRLEAGADNAVFYHRRFSVPMRMQLVHNEYYCAVLQDLAKLAERMNQERRRRLLWQVYNQMPDRLKPWLRHTAQKLKLAGEGKL